MIIGFKREAKLFCEFVNCESKGFGCVWFYEVRVKSGPGIYWFSIGYLSEVNWGLSSHDYPAYCFGAEVKESIYCMSEIGAWGLLPLMFIILSESEKKSDFTVWVRVYKKGFCIVAF